MSKPIYASALDVKRPIIPGFYPDPSIVRVGGTFYLANSTFEYGPGVPIHSSKDLVNWKFEGHSLPTVKHMDITGMVNSMGIFAPTIRQHNGKFYMITTLTDRKRQVLVNAENPAGPWSDPVRIDLFGIDPDLFWDENGDCYMTYASLPLNGFGQVKINMNEAYHNTIACRPRQRIALSQQGMALHRHTVRSNARVDEVHRW